MSLSEVKLGDFLELKRGYDLPKRKRKMGEIPVVSSSGFTGYHNEHKVEGPGVVTGRYGTLGEVFYVTEKFWPLNTSLYVTDFKGNHERYCAYLLEALLKNISSNKSSVPGVNRNVLHTLPVKVYSDISLQVELVSKLSKYDELIQNNKRRIELLEKSARLLYKEWFVQLSFPGHEHTKIVDGVPEGWEKKKIKDLGKIVTGKTPSTKNESYFGGSISFIKTPDMHGNLVVTSTELSLTEAGANTQKNKYLPKHSILVSCIGSVGIVSLNGKIAHTNQQINAIIPKKDSHRYWILFFAKELKPILEAIGGGATMNNVNKTKFSSIDCILPPQSLVEMFNDYAEKIVEQIEKLTLQNQSLSRARDLLLPKLMNGNIPV